MSKVHDDSASAATISPTYNPTSRQPVNCSARTTCYAAKAVVAGVATVLLTGWLAVSAAEVVAVNFGGGCPSACSGHGYCTAPKSETCSCYQGWGGGDCSISECRLECENCILSCTVVPRHSPHRAALAPLLGSRLWSES